MEDQQLDEVLRYADGVAGRVPAWAGSAAEVARVARARRVRQRRLTAAASGAAVLGVISVAVWWSGREPAPQTTPRLAADPAARDALAEFDRQAALLRLAMAPAEEPRVKKGSLGHASVRLQAAQTAGLLLFEADAMAKQPDQIDLARKRYERVITLFPQTRWAEQARAQLKKINAQRPAYDGPRRQGAYL